jgi:hypothetical protein
MMADDWRYHGTGDSIEIFGLSHLVVGINTYKAEID